MAKATTGTPTFASVLVAPAQIGGGEPRAVVAGAKTFIVGPFGSTTVWTSTNGGATFSLAGATGQGGGDSDLTVDEAGNVFVNDLLGTTAASTIPISELNSSGTGFHLVTKIDPTTSVLNHDRAWTVAESATDGPSAAGHLVVTARDVGSSPTEKAWTVDVPTTGPAVVHGPFLVAPATVGAAGPVIALPGHTYLQAYEGTDAAGNVGVFVAKSTDNGVTWHDHPVELTSGTTLFPVVAADAAGNDYVAWSGDNSTAAYDVQVITISSSVNGGTTWSAPAVIDAPRPGPLSSTGLGLVADNAPAIFPWVTARGAGQVDVTYAIGNEAIENPPGLLSPFGGSNLGLPTMTWNLELAQSLNATAAHPTWTTTTVVSGFHQGSICTIGTECLGPQNLGVGNLPTPLDRRDLDFVGSTVDAGGNLVVPYQQDRSILSGTVGDLIFPATDLRAARQVGGQNI